MALLLVKVFLAPLLVVGSSLAGRRWGPPVAGMLVALPIVAGPILLITCLERGVRFGAQAATAALSGLVTLALFATVFARVSRRFGWVATLAISWVVCLVADLFLARFPVPAVVGLVLALAAAATGAHLMPAIEGPAGELTPSTVGPPETARWPWWDLPGRAAATAVLVLAVTAASAALGPDLTGVLAPFPIATSVVAAFALAQRGSRAAGHVLRGVPRGLVGFSTFCFLVAVLVGVAGTGWAFGAALAGTVAVQYAWRRLLPARTAT